LRALQALQACFRQGWKNLGFFGFFLRFLGFFGFFKVFKAFLKVFLGFNVHNAEHRYMTHNK